jgi:lipoyl(octanoyl) transferase
MNCKTNNIQKEMQKVVYNDLGTIDYQKAWDFQEELHKSIVDDKIASRNEGKKSEHENYMLFCEHPHVYTLGKSGEQQNLLVQENYLRSIGAAFYKINRGGDITYHGPGQVVGYPIFDLEKFGLQVRSYIHTLEESIIRTLDEFGIRSQRLDEATGVWLDVDKPKPRKICAIGVRISRYVTMHGFALNVNTDLSYFRHINPCGFIDKEVTSMQAELGKILDTNEIKKVLRKNINQVFHLAD